MEFKPEDYRGPTRFVHLHNHTVFSTLDGVSTPEQYAEQCSKRGYPAMSATEHGTMGSVPDMYFAFKKYGLKYIPGCEIYFNDYDIERKDFLARGGKINQLKVDDPVMHANYVRNRHLTVLAKNEAGFRNLVKLTTQAFETGYYYRPRVWFDKLCEYKEGLIVLSGCLNGPVCHELRRTTPEGEPAPRMKSKDRRGALDWARRFKAVFGDDYKMETQMPGIPNDDMVFRGVVEIADMLKIDLALANDCHYLERPDFELQKIMMAIDQKTTIDDPNMFHVNSDEQYMKTRPELWARFKNNGYSKGVPDSVFEKMCDNTLEIAEQCEAMKFDGTPKIPTFDNADDKLRELVIKKLVEKGYHKIKKRYLIDGREVTHFEQAQIELDRMTDKGFSSYFLITHDLINYGASRGWPFSPRGSAGGSLVNHLLGISPINPLPWGLSFDRFLSPSRGGYMCKVMMPEPVSKGGRPPTPSQPIKPGTRLDGIDKVEKWASNEKLTVDIATQSG